MSDPTLSEEQRQIFEHARLVDRAMADFGAGLMTASSINEFNKKLDDIALSLRNMKI